MSKKTLILASNNKHKVEELKQLLAEYFEVKSMAEIGFHDEIIEDADTFAGNALLKAKALYEKFNCDCIADDSGLQVAALNNEPGVYSARYAGEPKDDNKNTDKLLVNLTGVANREARFVTSIAYITNGLPYLFEGEVKGSISILPKGSNGFGYDPVFVPIGYETTFAEMTSEQKNSLSHRFNAIQKFLAFLQAH